MDHNAPPYTSSPRVSPEIFRSRPNKWRDDSDRNLLLPVPKLPVLLPGSIYSHPVWSAVFGPPGKERDPESQGSPNDVPSDTRDTGTLRLGLEVVRERATTTRT